MLDADQRVDQREDETFSLNNLKDMPFSDFLILHKIYPKIFMLEIDSLTMNHQNERVAKQESANTGEGLQRKQTGRLE